MARHGREPHVRGPYDLGEQWRSGSRWRVDLVAGEGKAVRSYFATLAEARKFADHAREELGIARARTVEGALNAYELHLREKGNKPRTIRTTIIRLKQFFPEYRTTQLKSITAANARAAYEAFRTKRVGCTEDDPEGRPMAVDSHRNVLAETRTFLGWCVAQKWLPANPLEDVAGVGKRRKGKPQLRVDESRAWLDKALELADSYEGPGAGDGPVAAMCCFLLGMRCCEVVERVVRDVDDGGRLLWIPDSKTPAGRRTLEVPPVMVPYLKALTKGRLSAAPLFSSTERSWPRNWVKRICALAGVPVVSAHGLRGTHATLAMDRGTSGPVVAAQLGHESATTTCANYASRQAQVTGQQRRFMKVLQGGRK